MLRTGNLKKTSGIFLPADALNNRYNFSRNYSSIFSRYLVKPKTSMAFCFSFTRKVMT